MASPLLTLGDIVRRLDTPIHRVKYAIDACRIEPRQRAGIIRLWAEEDLTAIRAALIRIGGGREAVHA